MVMRKCRAWDKKSEEYVSLEKIWLTNGEIDIVSLDAGHDHYDVVIDEVVLEWGTGLFDRTGTEVFQNDIVELFGVMLVVVWVEKEAKFAFQNYEQPGIVDAFVFNATTMKDVTVVGNIHREIGRR